MTNQVRIQDSSFGAADSQGEGASTYDFAKISEKMHKFKKITISSAGGGGGGDRISILQKKLATPLQGHKI